MGDEQVPTDAEFRLIVLREELSFLKTGLLIGLLIAVVMVIAIVASLALSPKIRILNNVGYLAMIFIIVAGIILYCSFILGSATKLKIAISSTKVEISAESGSST